MRSAKDALDMLKWCTGYGLAKAQIWYVHRGAKDDTMVIGGSAIANLGSSFFTTGESDIPYHRIFKITFDGKPFFERPAKQASKARPRRRMRRTRR